MAVPPNALRQQAQPQSESQKQTASGYAAQSSRLPQSPGAQNREQQRIALLLEINNELLQEIDRLQAEGQGGATNQQQLQQQRSEGQPEKLASDLYINTIRRVQANLAYLMPRASQASNPAAQPNPNQPPGPAHMTPPPHMTALLPLYERLKSLFPDWQGLEGRMSVTSSSPRPNGPTAQYAGTTP